MKWLTVARDLRRRKARERIARFVAEGVRTVEELVRSPLSIDGALVTASAAAEGRSARLIESLQSRGVEIQTVSDAEFDSAADTEHSQGVLAIAQQPGHALASLVLPERARVLVLDAVQDPGNVGTLIRTAAALKVSAVVTLPGTVDVWNAKVVRSAVGMHFRLPTIEAPVDLFAAWAREQQVALWGTDAGGAPLGAEPAPARLAIAMGNEGAGLSDALRPHCSSIVSLPMAPDVESLNVAVAAGIILWETRIG